MIIFILGCDLTPTDAVRQCADEGFVNTLPIPSGVVCYNRTTAGSEAVYTSAMMTFTRMVQQQECAGVMVYGMEEYLNAYHIKWTTSYNNTVVNIMFQTTVLNKYIGQQ